MTSSIRAGRSRPGVLEDEFQARLNFDRDDARSLLRRPGLRQGDLLARAAQRRRRGLDERAGRAPRRLGGVGLGDGQAARRARARRRTCPTGASSSPTRGDAGRAGGAAPPPAARALPGRGARRAVGSRPRRGRGARARPLRGARGAHRRQARPPDASTRTATRSRPPTSRSSRRATVPLDALEAGGDRALRARLGLRPRDAALPRRTAASRPATPLEVRRQAAVRRADVRRASGDGRPRRSAATWPPRCASRCPRDRRHRVPQRRGGPAPGAPELSRRRRSTRRGAPARHADRAGPGLRRVRSPTSTRATSPPTSPAEQVRLPAAVGDARGQPDGHADPEPVGQDGHRHRARTCPSCAASTSRAR